MFSVNFNHSIAVEMAEKEGSSSFIKIGETILDYLRIFLVSWR